jgi:cysteine desulfurase / selenocysteine lyase
MRRRQTDDNRFFFRNMLDPYTIREDFSIYKNYTADTNKKLVYLDCASSSLTPDVVVTDMSLYYTQYRSNIERSSFGLAQRAKLECDLARKDIAQFINASTDELIFTSGATDAANKVVDMITQVQSARPVRILTSIAEHHSVFVTLLQKKVYTNYEVEFISVDETAGISCEIFEHKIKEYKPDYVFMQYANNVTGAVYKMSDYTKIVHSYNAQIVCDASQAVGHVHVDVEKDEIDILFFSGHKMLGPTGIGVLYCRKNILEQFHPTTYGGGAVESVSLRHIEFTQGVKRFEPGTQNISGIIGLASAVRYIEHIGGIAAVEAHSEDIFKYALSRLSQIDRLHYIFAPKNCGIISFYFEHVHTHDVEAILADSGVAVRSGYHCAETLVRHISDTPLTRISFYIYTTKEDIDILVSKLQEISALFN